jgi:hypothetical protein
MPHGWCDGWGPADSENPPSDPTDRARLAHPQSIVRRRSRPRIAQSSRSSARAGEAQQKNEHARACESRRCARHPTRLSHSNH